MLHFSTKKQQPMLHSVISSAVSQHSILVIQKIKVLSYNSGHLTPQYFPWRRTPPPPPKRNETKHTDTHFKSGLAPVSQQQNTQTWLWFREQSGIIGHGIFVHFDLKDLAKMEYHPSPICNCTQESMHSLRLSNRNIITEVSIGLHCIWKEKRKKWLST